MEIYKCLNILRNYCKRWKLKVYTKIGDLFLEKEADYRETCHSIMTENNLKLLNKFVYLGVTFTTGGSFHETHNCLAGKALKAKMNTYLYQFTDISIKHRLDLFDKLIVPILCCGADVSGFIQAPAIERVNLPFF